MSAHRGLCQRRTICVFCKYRISRLLLKDRAPFFAPQSAKKVGFVAHCRIKLSFCYSCRAFFVPFAVSSLGEPGTDLAFSMFRAPVFPWCAGRGGALEAVGLPFGAKSERHRAFSRGESAVPLRRWGLGCGALPKGRAVRPDQPRYLSRMLMLASSRRRRKARSLI